MEGFLRAAVAPYVDSYVAYTPTMVQALHVDGVFGNATVRRSNVIANHNVGLNGIGHLAAKPFVVLHRLAQVPDGDVVLYSDVNVLKHPALFLGLKGLRYFSTRLLRKAQPSTDVFVPFEGSERLVRDAWLTHARLPRIATCPAHTRPFRHQA